jgi:hypothetical protein
MAAHIRTTCINRSWYVDSQPTWWHQHAKASKQEPLECGDDSCTAGQSKTFSISVGFSVGSGGGPDNFANGGFAVSTQGSTTETDSCTGGKGDTVCLWYAVAHTAYTVEGCDELGNCPQYVMKSPNKNNLGGGFLCGKNDQCKSINTEIWKNNGPAGGPQAGSGVLDPSNLG